MIPRQKAGGGTPLPLRRFYKKKDSATKKLQPLTTSDHMNSAHANVQLTVRT